MSTVSDILKAVGYRIFQTSNLSIDANSSPNTTECIQWLNEMLHWILELCIERDSELGRTVGTITTAADTSEYTDLVGKIYVPADWAYIEEESSRTEIALTREKELLDYAPDEEGMPEKFYLKENGTIVFLPTPDDEYTVKIPYWPILTELTSTDDVVPFQGIFDRVLIETLVYRARHRNELDVGGEEGWLRFLLQRAEHVIFYRQRFNTKIIDDFRMVE